MNWLLKRWSVIGVWLFLLGFEAWMAVWAFAIGASIGAWFVLGLAVFLLVMGPGHWATMFADKEDRKGWWLREDL